MREVYEFRTRGSYTYSHINVTFSRYSTSLSVKSAIFAFAVNNAVYGGNFFFNAFSISRRLIWTAVGGYIDVRRFVRDYGKMRLIYELKKTPATRVAHKFSGIWLLISVYSLIRHYDRPAPSQRNGET